MGEPGVPEQKRYLELRLAACRHRPELHAHSIAAYEHNLRALAASPSLGAYLAYTDNLFEVCRAEWLDWRYNNLRIYASLGDAAKARTAKLQYDAGHSATGHADFSTAVCASHAEAAQHEANAGTAEGTLALLVTGLLDWHVETNTAVRGALLDKVDALWSTLRNADPSCTWQRLRSYPPYRDRLPFSDDALDVIGTWLHEAIPGVDNGATPPEGPSIDDMLGAARRSAHDYVDRLSAPIGEVAATDADNPVGPASDATVGYRATYAAIDPADPTRARARAAYERIFELEGEAASSTQLAVALAEHGMYGELARAASLDEAHAALARCEDTTDRYLEQHYRALIDTLDACRSPLEVLFETTRGAEYARAERQWTNVFLAFATIGLRAVATYEQAPVDMYARRVALAAQVTADVFGLTWEQTLAVPLIGDYFDRALFIAGARADISDVVEEGRVDLALGQAFQDAARAAVQARVQAAVAAATEPVDIPALVDRLKSEPRFGSPAEMRAHLTALYHQACPAPPSPPAPLPVVYWRATTALDALIDAIAAPPRPATVLD